jgi:hypothetical protein
VQAVVTGKAERQASAKPAPAPVAKKVKAEQSFSPEKVAPKAIADGKKKKAPAKAVKMAGFGDLRSMFKKK